MKYKHRTGTINLIRASLQALEAKLVEAQERVNSLEVKLEEANRASGRTAPGQLKQIEAQLTTIDSSLEHLRKIRSPKPGVLGKLFGLTEIPINAKEQIAALCNNQAELHSRKSELTHAIRVIGGYEGSIERARSWLSKVQGAVDRKRRKRDAVIELRAAAAANATTTRQVGTTVKRKLDRQPWCPYCGGALGADPHADHIYPVSKGGRSVPRNMVYVCAKCNSMKRNLTLTGFIRKYALDRNAIERRLEELQKEF